MSRKILGGKMRGGFAKPLNHNRRNGRKKIEADLSWDALARNYLVLFEEAIRLRAGATPE